jgi:hypothetical protein
MGLIYRRYKSTVIVYNDRGILTFDPGLFRFFASHQNWRRIVSRKSKNHVPHALRGNATATLQVLKDFRFGVPLFLVEPLRDECQRRGIRPSIVSIQAPRGLIDNALGEVGPALALPLKHANGFRLYINTDDIACVSPAKKRVLFAPVRIFDDPDFVYEPGSMAKGPSYTQKRGRHESCAPVTARVK